MCGLYWCHQFPQFYLCLQKFHITFNDDFVIFCSFAVNMPYLWLILCGKAIAKLVNVIKPLTNTLYVFTSLEKTFICLICMIGETHFCA